MTDNHRLHDKLLACLLLRTRLRGILLKKPLKNAFIFAARINSYADRFLIFESLLNKRGKVPVVTLARTNIAWIYPKFIERTDAIWIFGQQYMTVVMKITDKRNSAAFFEQFFFDMRNSLRIVLIFDRKSDNLAACLMQFNNLPHGSCNIRCGRVGHRLNPDRIFSAYANVANHDCNSLFPHLHTLLRMTQ